MSTIIDNIIKGVTHEGFMDIKHISNLASCGKSYPKLYKAESIKLALIF